MAVIEVPMGWMDFFWALERLRHRCYGSKETKQADWFKLNPLEVVLLACETLRNEADGVTVGNISGIVIGMKSVRSLLFCHVGPCARLIDVLASLVADDGGRDEKAVPQTTTVMQQRAIVALSLVYLSAKKSHGIYALVAVRFIEMVLPLLKQLLTGPRSLGFAGAPADELVVELNRIALRSTYSTSRSSTEALLIYVEELGLSNLSLRLKIFSCNDIINTSLFRHNYSVSLYSDLGKFDSRAAYIAYVDSTWSLSSFIDSIKASSLACSSCLGSFLDLVQEFDDEGTNRQIASFVLSSLTRCFHKWSTAFGSKSSVPEKLIQVCIVYALKETDLEKLNYFLDYQFDLLLAYSTEGYLSSDAEGFMLGLLDLLMTGLEVDMDLSTTLTSLLPNLFSPFFGIRESSVATKILELGCVALCSIHRKAILCQGLHFLGKVYRMFPPSDMIAVRQAAMELHAEALTVSESLIEDLLVKAVSSRSDFDNQEDLEVSASPSFETTANFTTAGVDERAFMFWPGPAASDTLRVQVVENLLDLVIAITCRGDDFTFLCGSVLPKVFQSDYGLINVSSVNVHKLRKFFGADASLPVASVSWTVDRKKFAVELLSLATTGVKRNLCSSFVLCGVAIPKLMLSIDEVKVTDEEKMHLTIGILQIARDELESGHDIEGFVSHGIDFLSNLMPEDSGFRDLQQFVSIMAKKFFSPSLSSILVLAKFSCDFMLLHFPQDKPHVQNFFQTLIRRGKRDEIRTVFRVCRRPFDDDSRHGSVRTHLLSFATGKISSRQLQSLCEHLKLIFSLEAPKNRFPSSQEENSERCTTERMNVVVRHVCGAFLGEIVSLLENKRYTEDEVSFLNARLSRFVLVKTLFGEKLAASESLPVNSLMKDFEAKFPHDVLVDARMMETLTTCGTRLEHIELPRYEFLKKRLVAALTFFLGSTYNCLVDRIAAFETELLSIPRNADDRARLLASGYSIRCWTSVRPVTVTVKTDGRYSIEENLRQSLLLCYRNYVELLKSIGTSKIIVNEVEVGVHQMFDESLSLNEMKGQRAIAVREIDRFFSVSKSSMGTLAQKMALLAEEDRIECDFEQKANAPIRALTFTASLHTSFFACSNCCGKGITGCYGPTGDHCERPMEIGLRQDSAFLSICGESGIEIENVEVLLTEEGAYIFKAYSNGHPYDTSEVWLSLFKELLNGSDPFFPAIIIPFGFPNQTTWNLIRRFVETELTGSVLTCRPDFSDDWKTYFDFRPEKVRCGLDLVLHKGFAIGARKALMRQTSHLIKDLAGELFDKVIHEMLCDNWMKRFRFLGKYIAQFVSAFISTGAIDKTILYDGFNYDRWRKTQKGSLIASKVNIVDLLANYVAEKVVAFCMQEDVEELFASKRKHFFELKGFAQEYRKTSKMLSGKYYEMLSVLRNSTIVIPILTLPRALQEELMRLIFRNEDREWRHRGGRDGHETVQQYIGFLDNRELCPALPGVVAFSYNTEENVFRMCDVLAYAVGEYVVLNESAILGGAVAYEVVTAWVSPRFRGLNLALSMYVNLMEQANCSFLLCDILKGSLDHIVESNFLLRCLRSVRLFPFVVQEQQDSYEVIAQNGKKEPFERLLIDTRPILIAHKARKGARYIRKQLPYFCVFGVCLVFGAAIVFRIRN